MHYFNIKKIPLQDWMIINASLYKKEIIKDLQTGKRRYIWPLSYIKDMRFN